VKNYLKEFHKLNLIQDTVQGVPHSLLGPDSILFLFISTENSPDAWFGMRVPCGSDRV
jgi:hypothetical protein